LSTGESIQRVYEYAVEPAVLQNLPGNSLLLPAPAAPGRDLLAVECDPQIITLPGAAASLAASLAATEQPGAVHPAARPRGEPELAGPRQQPASTLWQGSPSDSVPAWPAQRPAPRRSRPPD
jgi:hypothetical protein